MAAEVVYVGVDRRTDQVRPLFVEQSYSIDRSSQDTPEVDANSRRATVQAILRNAGVVPPQEETVAELAWPLFLATGSYSDTLNFHRNAIDAILRRFNQDGLDVEIDVRMLGEQEIRAINNP